MFVAGQTTGVLTVITDQILELTIPGFRRMTMPPDLSFAVSIVTDALYSMAGGWVRHDCEEVHPGPHSCSDRSRELIGAGTMIALWNTVPHYFSFALTAIYPPAV